MRVKFQCPVETCATWCEYITQKGIVSRPKTGAAETDCKSCDIKWNMVNDAARTYIPAILYRDSAHVCQD